MVRRLLTIALAATLTLAGRTTPASAAGPGVVAAIQIGPGVGPSTGSPPVERDRPIYVSEITRIPWRIRTWMTGLSWRAGCPVPLRRRRPLTPRGWGFDDEGDPRRPL